MRPFPRNLIRALLLLQLLGMGAVYLGLPPAVLYTAAGSLLMVCAVPVLCLIRLIADRDGPARMLAEGWASLGVSIITAVAWIYHLIQVNVGHL